MSANAIDQGATGAAGGVLSGTYPNPGYAAAPTFAGVVTVSSGGLIVTGGQTISTGNLAISAGSLTLTSGNISTPGNISTTSAGTITAAGGLTVSSGGATITGTVSVTGTTSLTGALNVTGNVDIFRRGERAAGRGRLQRQAGHRGADGRGGGGGEHVGHGELADLPDQPGRRGDAGVRAGIGADGGDVVHDHVELGNGYLDGGVRDLRAGLMAGCDRCGWLADAGRAGTATLVLGTVTVAAPAVTANSVIILTVQPGGTPLALPYVSGKTPGTGFTITSLSLSDTATIGWLIIDHA
jgi:adhesin HecA-like repeat protein